MTSSKTSVLELNELEIEYGSSDDPADQESSTPASANAEMTSLAAMRGLLNPALYNRADSGVAGMIAPLTGLTSSLARIHKSVNFLGAYPHLAGITSTVDTLAGRFGDIESAALVAMRVGKTSLGFPSAIEAMAGMNRTLAGLSSVAETMHALNQVGGVTSSLQALNMAGETPWSALIAGSAIGRQMDGVTSALDVCRGWSLQFERMAHFDSALSRMMLPDVHDVWSRHLRTIAVPTVEILARKWEHPMALLAELPEPGYGATVSWKAKRKRKEIVQTATVISDVEQGDVVVIEDEPLCAICGKPLMRLSPEVRWIGPKHAIRRQRIYPVCFHCGANGGELADLLQQAVKSQKVPKLRVVRGARAGDGVCRARGLLRLVRSDD